MADKEPDRKALQREACDRIADAKAEKSKVLGDLEECYYFAAPRRIRDVNSGSSSNTAPGDANELQTSIGFEVTDDFMTMLIDSFMPQSMKWAERHPDPFMPDAIKKTLLDQAKERDANIFEAIRGSNFYAELGKAGVPDAAIGVLAMDIRLKRPGMPIQCLGVPIRELEIALGPDGRIDDRFVVRKTIYRRLPALLQDVNLPREISEKIKDSPKQEVEVRWGYWRLWDRNDDEYWQHVIMVGQELVHDTVLRGSGSCPLAVGRFGATPDFAWPDGPLIKSLPDLRQIDDMRAGFIENIDFTLRPPISYPDDGVMNFAGGIEPGMAYAKRPGGGPHDLQKVYEPNPLDAAHFDEMNLEKRIRRLHYCDFPEQLGKTPPTASQWLDEMVEAQKKIGTPGYSFWREFPYEVFERFRFIAEASGAIQPLEVDGRRVSLQAYNPAQRAQENQEVLTATRLLQIAGSVFPQTLQVMVNDQQTLRNLQDKLGDKIVALRSETELKEAVANVAQLAGVGGPRLSGGLAESTSPMGAAGGG